MKISTHEGYLHFLSLLNRANRLSLEISVGKTFILKPYCSKPTMILCEIQKLELELETIEELEKAIRACEIYAVSQAIEGIHGFKYSWKGVRNAE